MSFYSLERVSSWVHMLTKALLQVWNETVATLTLMALGLLGRNGRSFSSIEHFLVREPWGGLFDIQVSFNFATKTDSGKIPFPRIKQLPAGWCRRLFLPVDLLHPLAAISRSSAPEIMLSLNDIIKRTFVQGKLGASTIATWLNSKGEVLGSNFITHRTGSSLKKPKSKLPRSWSVARVEKPHPQIQWGRVGCVQSLCHCGSVHQFYPSRQMFLFLSLRRNIYFLLR